MKGLKILIIDDEPLMRLSIVDALEEVGARVAAAASGTEGLRMIEKRDFDVVITDLRLPGADGLAILKASKERNPNAEVILITAHGSVDTAVGAMKLGAYDYITKPFQMEDLLLIVERVGKMFRLRRESPEVHESSDDRLSFGPVLARSQSMRAVLDQAKRAAATDATVLLVGERGTGKDLIAHAIHLHSARKDRPLVKVTCRPLPDAQLEAEIFGHEREAWPGGARRRRGRLELAHKGTLFLDEIGELAVATQATLLDFLERRRFTRVGGAESIDADVRLVCSTQKDLEAEVRDGRFRDDLWRRLSAVRIFIPPLRQRREDILLLAEEALRVSSGRVKKHPKDFSPAAQELLRHYSFPGNGDELERIVQRAVELTEDRNSIEPWALCGSHHCPLLGGKRQESCGFCREGLAGATSGPSAFVPLATAQEQFEREYITAVLNQAGGDEMTAAQILGVSLHVLGEKCKRYNLPSGVNSAAGEAV